MKHKTKTKEKTSCSSMDCGGCPFNKNMFAGSTPTQFRRFRDIFDSAVTAHRKLHAPVLKLDTQPAKIVDELIAVGDVFNEAGRQFHNSFKVDSSDMQSFPEFFGCITTIEQSFLAVAAASQAVGYADLNPDYEVDPVALQCIVLASFNSIRLILQRIFEDVVIHGADLGMEIDPVPKFWN